jgi:hypothetical protein
MNKERESETRELEFELTSEEVLDRARSLAEIETKLGELEAERKAVMAKFKFKKGELTEARRELSKAVTSGVDIREIECEWVPMWKQQQWVLQRTDTGDVIEQETMTKDDLQTSMDVGEETANDNGDNETDGEEEETQEKSKRKPRKPRKSSRSKAAGTED